MQLILDKNRLLIDKFLGIFKRYKQLMFMYLHNWIKVT